MRVATGEGSSVPAGLLYRPELISADEELALLVRVAPLEYGHVVLHGVPSKREVASFGWRYSFESNQLAPAPPIPHWLTWLRDRAAALASVDPATLEQALINRYPPGAGIGYHRDLPIFGSPVVGISLLGACAMRFQRGKGEGREVHVVELAPRSAYVLDGPARSQWEHGIPSCPTLRYSVTFRTLRHRAS